MNRTAASSQAGEVTTAAAEYESPLGVEIARAHAEALRESRAALADHEQEFAAACHQLATRFAEQLAEVRREALQAREIAIAQAQGAATTAAEQRLALEIARVRVECEATFAEQLADVQAAAERTQKREAALAAAHERITAEMARLREDAAREKQAAELDHERKRRDALTRLSAEAQRLLTNQLASWQAEAEGRRERVADATLMLAELEADLVQAERHRTQEVEHLQRQLTQAFEEAISPSDGGHALSDVEADLILLLSEVTVVDGPPSSVQHELHADDMD